MLLPSTPSPTLVGMPPRRKHLPAQPAPGTTTPGGPTTVDTTANPAGPPEGTDHGHQGVGGEVPEAAVSPLAAPSTPPEVQAHPRTTGSPSGRLVAYLLTHHPQDYPHVTPDGPEHPADTAVRIMTRLGTTGLRTRCQEAYCNLTPGHPGTHGWVNV